LRDLSAVCTPRIAKIAKANDASMMPTDVAVGLPRVVKMLLGLLMPDMNSAMKMTMARLENSGQTRMRVVAPLGTLPRSLRTPQTRKYSSEVTIDNAHNNAISNWP
jgi:hypothetical protein